MDDQHEPVNQTTTQAWVQRWIRLSTMESELGKDSAETQALSDVLSLFDDNFRSALALHPPEPTSGLIEQQAVFRRWRRGFDAR